MFAYLRRSSIGGLLSFSVYARSRPLNLSFKSNGPIDFELSVQYSKTFFVVLSLCQNLERIRQEFLIKPHIFGLKLRQFNVQDFNMEVYMGKYEKYFLPNFNTCYQKRIQALHSKFEVNVPIPTTF